MKKKYIVKLTADEKIELEKLIRSGKSKARTLTKARILLKADESDGGNRWSDREIAEALEVGTSTVERTRMAFVEESLEIALNGIKRKPRPPTKVDGRVEAYVIKLACSTPPEGRGAWTLKLLANGLVEADVVDSISKESVRLVLKKTNLSPGKKNNGAYHQIKQMQNL